MARPLPPLHPFASEAEMEAAGALQRRRRIATPQAIAAHQKLARAKKLGQHMQLPPLERRRSASPPAALTGPSFNAPTPQRLAKDEEWERTTHAGGQVSHRSRSVLVVAREHLQAYEAQALDKLVRDAQAAAGKVRFICERAYTGRPLAPPIDPSAFGGDIDGEACLEYVLCKMSVVPDMLIDCLMLVIEEHRAATGKPPMTAREYALTASKFTDKNHWTPFTVASIKWIARTVCMLQRDFVRFRRAGYESEEFKRRQVKRIRALIEAEVKAKYASKIDDLTSRVADLEAARGASDNRGT